MNGVKRGMTMVELLVAVGSVCIALTLIVLLVIYAQRARQNALKISNMNNLRQLAEAVQLYASDRYYGVMPRWKHERDGGDQSENDLVTALGRLYSGGQGIVKEYPVFHCPNVEAFEPKAFGSTIAGRDDIDDDRECSYSWTRGAQIADLPNKILLADEADESKTKSVNWEEGQAAAYWDGSVRFLQTDNPEDDADLTSIYREDTEKANAVPENDTVLY